MRQASKASQSVSQYQIDTDPPDPPKQKCRWMDRPGVVGAAAGASASAAGTLEVLLRYSTCTFSTVLLPNIPYYTGWCGVGNHGRGDHHHHHHHHPSTHTNIHTTNHQPPLHDERDTSSSHGQATGTPQCGQPHNHHPNQPLPKQNSYSRRRARVEGQQ